MNKRRIVNIALALATALGLALSLAACEDAAALPPEIAKTVESIPPEELAEYVKNLQAAEALQQMQADLPASGDPAARDDMTASVPEPQDGEPDTDDGDGESESSETAGQKDSAEKEQDETAGQEDGADKEQDETAGQEDGADKEQDENGTPEETAAQGESSTPEETAVPAAPVVPAAAGSRIVVIDPGHSAVMPPGTEPLGPGSTEQKAKDAVGTHGAASGLMEYQLALTVSAKLRQELTGRGYTVVMTREDSDHAISCKERAEVANAAGAGAYVRIHANGASSASANGAMTICITQGNPYTAATYAASSRLSQAVLEEYCRVTGRRSEGVWYTDTMSGNNWSRVPTTLIEMGYMTNTAEDLWMASEEGQALIVKGIADGIDRYFAEGN